jgi:hypothetical protein
VEVCREQTLTNSGKYVQQYCTCPRIYSQISMNVSNSVGWNRRSFRLDTLFRLSVFGLLGSRFIGKSTDGAA